MEQETEGKTEEVKPTKKKSASKKAASSTKETNFDRVALDLEMRGFWLVVCKTGEIPKGKGKAFDAFVKRLKEIALQEASGQMAAPQQQYVSPEVSYGAADNSLQNSFHSQEIERKKAMLAGRGVAFQQQNPQEGVVLVPPTKPLPQPMGAAVYGGGMAGMGTVNTTDFANSGGGASLEDVLSNMAANRLGDAAVTDAVSSYL